MLDNIKDMKVFYDKLDKVLETILKYRDIVDMRGERRASRIEELEYLLNKTSNLFDNFGFTYRPTLAKRPDTEEFNTTLSRYLDGFQDYLDRGSLVPETLAVDIRNLIYLIDGSLVEGSNR